MARMKKTGKEDLTAMQEKALKGLSDIEQLRAMLAQREKEQRELEQKIEAETIRKLGSDVQPYVVRFNDANLNVFDFLNDACGAFERGEAVLISGKEYKAVKNAQVTTVQNSFGYTTAEETDMENEEDDEL